MKIWTYGCSFTSGFKELFLDEKTWPNLLDIGIEYETMNRGHAGGGFYDVREHVLEDIGNISKQDLIVIQLPTSNRVCVPYFDYEWDSFLKIRSEHPEDTVGWLGYMKNFDGLVDTLGHEASVVFKLLSRLKLTWFWWSAERSSDTLNKFLNQRLSLDEYYTYEDWIWANKQYWLNEEDWHQNVEGHVAMARAFSIQIQKYLQKEKRIKQKLL